MHALTHRLFAPMLFAWDSDQCNRAKSKRLELLRQNLREKKSRISALLEPSTTSEDEVVVLYLVLPTETLKLTKSEYLQLESDLCEALQYSFLELPLTVFVSVCKIAKGCMKPYLVAGCFSVEGSHVEVVWPGQLAGEKLEALLGVCDPNIFRFLRAVVMHLLELFPVEKATRAVARRNWEPISLTDDQCFLEFWTVLTARMTPGLNFAEEVETALTSAADDMRAAAWRSIAKLETKKTE